MRGTKSLERYSEGGVRDVCFSHAADPSTCGAYRLDEPPYSVKNNRGKNAANSAAGFDRKNS
jgi:hypothetical protein